METQTTNATTGSRLLFSRYKDDKGISWSLRLKREQGKPLTLCRSQRDTGAATVDIMEALFDDPRVEAILSEILRRKGEPGAPAGRVFPHVGLTFAHQGVTFEDAERRAHDGEEG